MGNVSLCYNRVSQHPRIMLKYVKQALNTTLEDLQCPICYCFTKVVPGLKERPKLSFECNVCFKRVCWDCRNGMGHYTCPVCKTGMLESDIPRMMAEMKAMEQAGYSF